ncbi:zinc-ribbon domain-containing protein [bacterium]|nr:MAG: zinc-ribbon domain-containing protein [bacterium]
MRQCSSCGTKNADDAVFCSMCGTSFAGSQPQQFMQPVSGPTKPVPAVRTITPLAQTAPQFSTPTARPQTTVGSCFYHPELPASYICVRCGRQICFSCTRPYGQLAICPQCYWTVAPRPAVGQQGR